MASTVLRSLSMRGWRVLFMESSLDLYPKPKLMDIIPYLANKAMINVSDRGSRSVATC
jgi:hypothetical protein